MLIYKLIFLSIIYYYTANAQFYECSNNVECIASDSECKDGLCKCPPGKLISKQGTKCLEVAKEFGGKCEENIQCVRLTGEYYCTHGKCTCNDKWVYTQGKCQPLKGPNDKCSTNLDCFDGYDYLATVCKNNKCACQDGYYLRNNQQCRKESQENMTCIFDVDCKFENAKCNNGICTKKDIAAFKFLPETKSVDNFSYIETESDDPETCDKQPNSYFSVLTQSCVCKRGYVSKLNKGCVHELGSSCKNNDECKGSQGVCTGKVCTCATGKIMDESSNTCRKAPVSPNFDCLNDKSCRIFLNHYYCDKVCKCEKGYYINPNGVCESDDSQCSDEDCDKKFKNSVCSTLNTCICEPGFYFKEDKEICLPHLGSTCTDVAPCDIDNSECDKAKNVCKCKTGYAANGDDKCLKVSSIGNKCENNVQCSSKFSNSLCKEGKCVCEESFMEIEGYCIKHPTRIGEFCTDKKMCENLGVGSICRNTKCVCDKEYIQHKNEKCILKISNGSGVLKINLMWLSLVIFYNFA